MNNTDEERGVEVRLDLARFGIPAGTASALDAWKAATLKSANFILGADGKPVRGREPLVVQGTAERPPVREGVRSRRLAKRGFRVLAVP